MECPFCKNIIPAGAIVCGFCRAEYGYLENNQVTNREICVKGYVVHVMVSIGILAISVFVTLFSKGEASSWAFISGLISFVLVLTGLRGLGRETGMKRQGKQWYK
jgi:hypothetical protein